MIIGIDVSKEKLDCLWLKDVENLKVKTKVFKNRATDHQALLNWSIKQGKTDINAIHFVMEATGVYHEQLAYCLYKAGAKVSVVNPAKIKFYARSLGVRTKTDKKDSMVIARYGATQRPALWQPEPDEIKILKALLSRHEAVSKDIQREKNRREKAEVACVGKDVLDSIHTVLKHLHTEQARLEKLIEAHIDHHPNLKNNKKLLESIPGVGPVLARYMMSLVGSRKFTTAPQCAAFIGLIPIEHESGSSVRGRPRLSKAGSATMRAKLYMPAVVAIQHNPDIRRQYQRLIKNGKAPMAAICAAMRKLVHICFGVLKHQTPYRAQVDLMACA